MSSPKPAVASNQVLGTCHHDCPDSCGWSVQVDAGVAVKLTGNPAHPYSRGELCPKVNRFLDRVYSPDRLLHPLIRTGTKGTASFRQATWDEALAAVSQRLHEIIGVHGGEAVLPWGDAGTQGLIQMNSLDRRFFARMGSSRQIDSLCGATAKAGTALTTGTPLCADPMDVVHAKLILLWGTNTRLTNRHLWPFIEEARAEGAKVVVIDPLRTITAVAADQFVQPLPGTDVAMMLAMMHVLIREDLLDHDYITAHTEGFEELRLHVEGWTPERAADICGITATVIEALAVEYGTVQPAFIRTLIGAEHREHGAMFFRTLSCLPLLTGSWRHRGGGYARSVGSYNDANIDDSVFDAPRLEAGRPRRGLSMNRLGRVLTDPDLDPRVHALFVYNGNPLVTAPNAELIRRGLEREDLFTVVAEQFMTDTARYADVIFPATTQIEHLDVVPSWGHLFLGWNEPAIEPVGECASNTELWRRLARAMGYDEPELFEDDLSLIRSAVHGVDLDDLRHTGFVRLSLPENILPFADGGFPTSNGRARFADPNLVVLGMPSLPTYTDSVEGPRGSDALRGRFPLSLMSPKTHLRFLNSSYSHLQHHVGAEGEIYCELDPIDAADRGISDGDRVLVWNDRGSLEVMARVPAADERRVRPGVVSVPFGWVGERTTDGRTVNGLTNDRSADHGGGVAFYDTLVDVRKI